MALHPSTVLIFGAGLSYDYGYPLGSKLIQDLIDDLPQNFDTTKARLKTGAYWSIDSYLSTYKDDEPALIQFIHKILLKKESHDDLFREGKHAYRLICHQMFNVNFEGFRIVSFNYDRSFEIYLYLFLKAKKKTEEEINKIFEMLDIVHVYGRLPDLPFENPSPDQNDLVIEYSYYDEHLKGIDSQERKIFEMKLTKHAEQIKTIYSFNHQDNGVLKLSNLIFDFDRIVFLGFGFHELNMKVLGFNKELKVDMSKKQILATLFEVDKVDQVALFKKYPHIKFFDSDCENLFRNHVDLSSDFFEGDIPNPY